MRAWLIAGALLFDWLAGSRNDTTLAVAWWIPLVMAAVGGASNFFGNRSRANQANRTPQAATPDQLGISPTLPDGSPNPLWQYLQSGIIPGSDQPTITNMSGASSTKTDSTTTQKGTSKTFPTYLPQAQSVVDMIPNLLKNRLLEGGKVQPAEKMGVLNRIQQDSSLAERGLVNQLADRGFLGSPVEAGARESLSRAGLAARTGYETQIPQIERQRGIDDTNLVSNILQGIFKGSQTDMSNTARTTGISDTMSSSQTTTQGPPQFDPRVLGALLQPPQQGGPSGWDAVGGISEILMMLWGMGALDRKGATGSGRLSTGQRINRGASGYGMTPGSPGWLALS